ncbi:MAG TPA: cupin domain-containing protein [Candidatus Wunengus sp. YC60]|uniref:cupin domain-containing protein n=1 Tax=Candidatus Wunengus sp. YC60 TaxID=3367697 RepID=UPI00402541C7
MNIIHLSDVKEERGGHPLFTGDVIRQSPLDGMKDADLSVTYVYFPKGVRNKFHSHSNGQVLIVTKGSGIIATESKKFNVKVGDIIWIPAGEIHWHGADATSDFTHISVTKAGTQINQSEK